MDGAASDPVPHPPIVSPEDWRDRRLRLLASEKALTKHYDQVSAERRRLPMVRNGKDYAFDAPDGRKRFVELFEGRRQLIVYHFMFDPDWEKGCGGCTYFVNSQGDLSGLHERDTTFALVSRAPLAKLEAYKAQKGWRFRWYSSFGSDFNYDFHVTLDASVTPVEYNYRTAAELLAINSPNAAEGEEHGLSVFFRLGDDIFHTYSTYARGTELLFDTATLLDQTPYGRQQSFEDSPPGWPQRATYG